MSVLLLGPRNCQWTEGRWHLGPRGIHAGDSLWFRVATMFGPYDPVRERPGAPLGPGPWRRVRVESYDEGRALTAHLELDDIEWTVRLTEAHELAWEVDGPGQCPHVAHEGSGCAGSRCRLQHEHGGAHVYGTAPDGNARCRRCTHRHDQHTRFGEACGHCSCEGFSPWPPLRKVEPLQTCKNCGCSEDEHTDDMSEPCRCGRCSGFEGLRRPRPIECYCGSSTRADGFPCVRGECPMGPLEG